MQVLVAEHVQGHSDDHRQREDGAKDQHAPLAVELGLLPHLPETFLRLGEQRPVAGPRDRAEEVRRLDRPMREGDLRPFEGEVDAGVEHAGHAPQGLLDPSRASGAGHALHRERQRVASHGEARPGHGLRHGWQVRRVPVDHDDRPLRRQVDRRLAHAGCAGQRLLQPRRTRGAGHALDVEGQALRGARASRSHGRPVLRTGRGCRGRRARRSVRYSAAGRTSRARRAAGSASTWRTGPRFGARPRCRPLRTCAGRPAPRRSARPGGAGRAPR